MGFADELRKANLQRQLDEQKRREAEPYDSGAFRIYCATIRQACKAAANQGRRSAEGYMANRVTPYTDEYGVASYGPTDVLADPKRDLQYTKFTGVPVERDYWKHIAKTHGVNRCSGQMVADVKKAFQAEGFTDFTFECRTVSVHLIPCYFYYFRAVW